MNWNIQVSKAFRNILVVNKITKVQLHQANKINFNLTDKIYFAELA